MMRGRQGRPPNDLAMPVAAIEEAMALLDSLQQNRAFWLVRLTHALKEARLQKALRFIKLLKPMRDEVAAETAEIEKAKKALSSARELFIVEFWQHRQEQPIPTAKSRSVK